MERWFRVNTINDAGNPSSATVGTRLTQAYMNIVHNTPNPSEEVMKMELNRIFKSETIDGEKVNTTDKFNDFLISEIENKALSKGSSKSKAKGKK